MIFWNHWPIRGQAKQNDKTVYKVTWKLAFKILFIASATYDFELICKAG